MLRVSDYFFPEAKSIANESRLQERGKLEYTFFHFRAVTTVRLRLLFGFVTNVFSGEAFRHLDSQPVVINHRTNTNKSVM